MATIIDVRNTVSKTTNVRYKWGRRDFAQISENRHEHVEITDFGENILFVKFDEVEHLIEALSRISMDIKAKRYVEVN